MINQDETGYMPFGPDVFKKRKQIKFISLILRMCFGCGECGYRLCCGLSGPHEWQRLSRIKFCPWR